MARGMPKNWPKRERAPDALPERTVSDAPLAAVIATPEARARGTWDAFAVLRDPGAPAATERGELDGVLAELFEYTVRHGSDALRLAIEARAAAIGLQLQGVAALVR